MVVVGSSSTSPSISLTDGGPGGGVGEHVRGVRRGLHLRASAVHVCYVISICIMLVCIIVIHISVCCFSFC